MMTGLPCRGGDRPSATRKILFHYPERGKLQVLTADIHVEDVVDGRVVVIDGEGVDAALRAEDPHQPELTDVPEQEQFLSLKNLDMQALEARNPVIPVLATVNRDDVLSGVQQPLAIVRPGYVAGLRVGIKFSPQAQALALLDVCLDWTWISQHGYESLI